MTYEERRVFANEYKPTLDATDQKNWLKLERLGDKISGDYYRAKDDPMENIDIALGMGRDQVMSTIGAIGEWAGLSDGTLRKQAEASQEKETTRFNKPMDDEDMNILDSRFWTQKVPQSVPFMLALAPAQIAGATAGASLAGSIGLGTLGKFLAGSTLSGLSSRFAEGIAEGSQTFTALKDQGIDEKTASERAWATVKGNMALALSDISQMAVTFAPVGKLFPKMGKSTLGKFLVPGGKFVFDGATEGGEEVFQGYVQQYNIAKGK